MNIYYETLLSISNNEHILKYIAICQNAQLRASTRRQAKGLLGYVESHHIVPKAFKLGGEKDKLNLVHLTAAEHFTCHQLLVEGLESHKFYYFKSLNAIKKFTQNNKYQKRILTAEDYAYLRECINIAHTGENNPNFGNKWTEETKLEAKYRIKARGGHIGENNPRYGEKGKNCWIVKDDSKEEKLINIDDLNSYLLLGFRKGRIMSIEQITKITGVKKSVTHNQNNSKAQKQQRWVFNATFKETKRIHVTELNDYLSAGWERGRYKDK